MTLPRSLTSYLRPLGLGALLASLLTEIYWTLTVQVIIPPYGHDTPVTMVKTITLIFFFPITEPVR